MTGLPVTDLDTAKEAVLALQGTGTRCVVLTLGKEGLLYAQLDEASKKWSAAQHIAAEKVTTVVDTTVS